MLKIILYGLGEKAVSEMRRMILEHFHTHDFKDQIKVIHVPSTAYDYQGVSGAYYQVIGDRNQDRVAHTVFEFMRGLMHTDLIHKSNFSSSTCPNSLSRKA